MSLRTYHAVVIDCDECGETIADTTSQTPEFMRAEAQRRGWLQAGDRDLCQQCQHEAAGGDQEPEFLVPF